MRVSGGVSAIDRDLIDPYLIWSHEHARWWAPARSGYVTRISLAGRYPRTEAVRLCADAAPGTSSRLGALPDLPVRLADVDAVVEAYTSRYGDNPVRDPWR
jgi:hypothetical protein